MKKASFYLAIAALLGILAAPLFGQAPPAAKSQSPILPLRRPLQFQSGFRAESTVSPYHQSRELSPRGRAPPRSISAAPNSCKALSGEARVDSKSNRMEIEAKFTGFENATKFGLEYLTYVLWAVSPQGRAVNLGELPLKNGSGQVKAISDMQTFGMIVTAEPYFAVTQPGNMVVLENVLGSATQGKVENIDAQYELLGRGIYSSSKHQN